MEAQDASRGMVTSGLNVIKKAGSKKKKKAYISDRWQCPMVCVVRVMDTC